MPALSQRDGLHVLNLGADENRFSPDWLSANPAKLTSYYFCFPEVDIHIPFAPGMAALIQSKLTPRDATASMVAGLTGKDPHTLGTIKTTMYAEAAAALTEALTEAGS